MPYTNKANTARASKRHALANKKAKAERKKWRQRLARAYTRELRTDYRCPDCHLLWPWFVYDFHHRPNTEKVAAIYKLVKNVSALTRIMTEVDKCDIVCASCHRLRHEEDFCNGRKT